jgi:hypothetical protein
LELQVRRVGIDVELLRQRALAPRESDRLLRRAALGFSAFAAIAREPRHRLLAAFVDPLGHGGHGVDGPRGEVLDQIGGRRAGLGEGRRKGLAGPHALEDLERPDLEKPDVELVSARGLELTKRVGLDREAQGEAVGAGGVREGVALAAAHVRGQDLRSGHGARRLEGFAGFCERRERRGNEEPEGEYGPAREHGGLLAEVESLDRWFGCRQQYRNPLLDQRSKMSKLG